MLVLSKTEGMARFFMSRDARFTSVDPSPGNLQNPQSQNRYNYTLNNPLKFVDPSGKLRMGHKAAQAAAIREAGGGEVFMGGPGPNVTERLEADLGHDINADSMVGDPAGGNVAGEGQTVEDSNRRAEQGSRKEVKEADEKGTEEAEIVATVYVVERKARNAQGEPYKKVTHTEIIVVTENGATVYSYYGDGLWGGEGKFENDPGKTGKTYDSLEEAMTVRGITDIVASYKLTADQLSDLIATYERWNAEPPSYWLGCQDCRHIVGDAIRIINPPTIKWPSYGGP